MLLVGLFCGLLFMNFYWKISWLLVEVVKLVCRFEFMVVFMVVRVLVLSLVKDFSDVVVIVLLLKRKLDELVVFSIVWVVKLVGGVLNCVLVFMVMLFVLV